MTPATVKLLNLGCSGVNDEPPWGRHIIKKAPEPKGSGAFLIIRCSQEVRELNSSHSELFRVRSIAPAIDDERRSLEARRGETAVRLF